MNKNTDNDSELFFWIKSGEEKNHYRIPSIQSRKPKTPPRKMKMKKPKNDTDSARAGLKPGWIRATIIVREENLKKVKALAYWERKDIKQIIDEALNSHFKDREIQPIPEKQ
ncbi:MAG: hypothetical protein GY839_18670 [candidate division Zixibacteria bacterium]|nr:hypothetical protein [candidate division Zixibacteria bacterium]